MNLLCYILLYHLITLSHTAGMEYGYNLIAFFKNGGALGFY